MDKNIQHNIKAFFKYIRGKEKVRTSVGPLRNITERVVSDKIFHWNNNPIEIDTFLGLSKKKHAMNF